ncbi:YppG family protein [Oceanobacillus rekensis]|uniref:YppG family protein n=1 Tax=Oceanobacillus rekensis TaxID=937927 RepID=UPI000B4393DE|nr:YppG family protein [Oceanobacillus rekensis]
MRYRSYIQPQDYPPVNYNFNPSQNHTSHYPNENWNVPESYQTPYELFAKPEMPVQWLYESQMDADPLKANTGNIGGASEGFTGENASGPAGGPTSYFNNGNGQIDFDKVLSTVGQLANTYHQVSPIVKQFSSLIKNFR